MDLIGETRAPALPLGSSAGMGLIGETAAVGLGFSAAASSAGNKNKTLHVRLGKL
jgi:hypothetical protein